MIRGAPWFLAALLLLGSAPEEGPDRWQVWTLVNGTLSPGSQTPSAPRPVGSLQKPWVLKAWAAEHAGEKSPEYFCSGAPACWRAGGHGWLGLRRAIAESCNAYFIRLARSTSGGGLVSAFTEAGFLLEGIPGPEAAIGLQAPSGVIRISPPELLRAFRQLIREPWTSGETHRLELLRGLEEAGRSGTASSPGLRGLLVKTGTVSRGGNVLEDLTGWVLAATPDGEELALGKLEKATGRLAALELGQRAVLKPLAPQGNETPADPAENVAVWVFSALAPEEVHATNLSPAPVLADGPSGPRWLGQGATTSIRPGDNLAGADWELTVQPYGLKRRFRGSLEMLSGRGAEPGRLVLRTPVRSYVEGVIRAELSSGSIQRQRDLAAAILRFLGRGDRHPPASVCDRNHCAWFLGEGPEVLWKDPRRPLHQESRAEPLRIDDETFRSIIARSKTAGPSLWTDHCGGRALSEWEVWGRGSRQTWPCPRHRSPTKSWSRPFPSEALAELLGGPVRDLRCSVTSGYRRTVIELESGRRLELSFDELHRRLASRFGWGSLPSPPERASRKGDTWVLSGHGAGHRVGLCLSD